MHKLLPNLLIFLFLLHTTKTIASSTSDTIPGKIEFISPVEIPISLAGNFGELRPGHFHAGLDIRTQGREGLKIRSIYKGYVSRIAVSLYGYGKVVYVTHPNGYTSVYAHLSRFNDELENFIKNEQYRSKNFEVELYPEAGQFKLNQGDRVGWSGNTGGSGGPHLHFEIRNTLSEKPINPLHFNFKVTDNIAPTLKHLTIYPLNENSSIDHNDLQKTYKLSKSGNTYYLNGGIVPIVKGKIGFGIEAMDKVNNSPFSNGVYSIELLKDNQRVYYHVMDSIGFDKTRYINAHMDYHQKVKNRKKVQRSYLLEGNKLDIYKDLVNNGQLFFVDSSTHNLEYRVMDFYGNTSTLKFKVKSNQLEHHVMVKKESVQTLKYGEPNYFENDNLRINIPASCLYEDTPLYLKEEKAIGRCVTPRYHVNRLSDPLQDYIDLSINVNSIPENQRSKLVIVSLNAKSGILAAEGGGVDSNWISVKTRSFGPYTVMKDTIPPRVKNTIAINGQSFNENQKITFSVKDDISGLGRYEAFVDEEWHLIEYQKNKSKAFLKLDRVQKTGSKHDLRVEFTDKVGNKTIERYYFFY
ncbi:MAG: hypothetical protein CL840_07105 [Crocinitomicaceae bacterium]|nr:hypothetical protein [Crocinitomicaceae bacterium]|tara:strand:- start:9736 stop:11475 length:1740 start_codon:yes stop_codon:yes gene_type:complete